MGYALGLLELLLVEGDVVVAGYVLKWLQEVVFEMLLALLLLYDDRALEVKVVLFFQNIEERWVSASINTDFLELVPEVVLDRLLLEVVPLEDDVVLTFENEAVDDEVLFLEKVSFLQE